ncbi:Lrp/AsnC family transcriptional regulator [Riemerella anatipestifer]|uniref:Lrp/AsnC family transcriptional regulator n=1 Tax=Riemerella anatipestifer TaxID=34085 RepID=A0AAP6HEQ3_RIEAN|nr:Lrp/AsnC family transcriptional regulator [Riemerella anatipestifer]MBT0549218.1 Lrp/AsnC family transcriptional regulator [Riemerella anatipestifer]MBT0555779.1 Lrp/AsnC family transcriptional regulator [Riemerella anatipestifer]MBT0559981.1 Lrp/AsnC family transcriptional regulator [Riemerella anatipestifer]MDW3556681.1 Lrp/AsnC family transcriptional regulator [Riemerella anatipestifer]MDY3338546.1 Lrp/AsnC family transcriptional regulator [Riemerella anatipestifer]
MKLDQVDFSILRELVKDSSQSVKEIAAKVSLSVTPVHDRIKKLEANGYIKGYTAIVDAEKLGYGFTTYMQVKLIKHQEEIFNKFKEEILSFEEVTEAAFTSGDYDVIMKLLLRDLHHYEDFILRKISKLDIIDSIKSSFTFKYIKNNHQAVSVENIK